MKLLVDARCLGRRPSGVGMYIYNFLIYLLDKKYNIDLMIVTDVIESQEMEQLCAKGVRIYSLNRYIKKGFGLFAYYHYIQEIINKEKPDIFWEPNNLFLTGLKNPYGKIVVTIHDLFPLTHRDCYSAIYSLFFLMGIGNTLRNTDAVIYDSMETMKKTQELLSKSSSVPHFVSYIIIPPFKQQEIRDDGYFLYIGNLEKRKGIDTLLYAIREYWDNGGDRELYLAGKIRDKSIKALIEDTQKKYNKLQYKGYISKDERDHYYATCHTFVFPSRAEGFGMPVIEALQCHKPIIVRNLDIYREIVPGCVSSFESNPSDISCEANALCNELFTAQHQDSEAAERILARYSPERLTDNLFEFLKSIIY